MKSNLKNLLLLAFFNILILILIWLPYLLKLPSFYGFNFSEGFPIIYKNFDGLEYIIIAKTFYNPSLIAQIPQNLPVNYFPAHFPGFPITIALFAPILGFLKSMLFTSVLFTILSSFAFYLLVQNFKLTSQPLWLSLVFLLLPARWVIVHSVGSPEPMFIFFTIMAIYFFMKFQQNSAWSNILYTAVFASLAQLTRPPGILLFVALGIFILYNQIKKRDLLGIFKAAPRYFPLLLIPLTLLGIFTWFQISVGDFWAYFHTGDNIHLTFPPYQVFNKAQYWVGDIWLEDIVYIFLFGFLGGIILLRKNLHPAGIFVFVYLAASILVAHRDIARYTLPIAPFILIAFEKALTSREFKIALALVALGIYLYTQNFLLANTAPIPNLSIFN